MENMYELPVSDFKDCVICAGSQTEGITVLNSFICSKCEEDIRKTEAGEKEYSFYVDRLKALTTHINSSVAGAVQK